jgi:hypothetical protein
MKDRQINKEIKAMKSDVLYKESLRSVIAGQELFSLNVSGVKTAQTVKGQNCKKISSCCRYYNAA